MEKYNILIVDDHALIRSGIICGIGSLTDNYHFIEAGDGQEAIEKCLSHDIHLMLLDISLPIMDGLAVIEALRIRRYQVKTIVFSFYSDPILVLHLLKLGIQGYLSKSATPSQLLEAIQNVIGGDRYFPSDFLNKLPIYLQESQVVEMKLSKKEREIIELLSKGLTSKEIAEATGYTKRAVETKKLRLERRFNTKSSSALVGLAYRLGILRM